MSHNDDTKRSRAGTTFRGALILAIVLLTGVCLLIGYPVWRIRAAKSRITKYCDGVSVGQRVALGAMARDADKTGFRVFGPVSDPEASPVASETLLVHDGWGFARWFCEVKAADGIVTSKSISFLD